MMQGAACITPASVYLRVFFWVWFWCACSFYPAAASLCPGVGDEEFGVDIEGACEFEEGVEGGDREARSIWPMAVKCIPARSASFSWVSPRSEAEFSHTFPEILDEGVFVHALRMTISDKTSRDY